MVVPSPLFNEEPLQNLERYLLNLLLQSKILLREKRDTR